MQKLGKPWYRRRALRIFRDDTSLAATPELWPTIERALGESRYLVLLASPQFAASKWCGLEWRRWLDDQGPATILIALTEGELVVDEAAGDFHWSAATPLPDALRGQFKVEPKWIDLRPYREAPNANDVKFMEAAADLAAAVHGTPREDLLSQEVRQQRRALSLAWSAAGVLTVFAGLAAWQWSEAVKQQRTAQAQRDRAERALSAATQTANTLVIDLANEFRDRTGMPSDLVRRILDRARGLQQQLLDSARVAGPARQRIERPGSVGDHVARSRRDRRGAGGGQGQGCRCAPARRCRSEQSGLAPDTVSRAQQDRIGFYARRPTRGSDRGLPGIAGDYPGDRRRRSRQVALAEGCQRHDGAPRPGA